MQNIFSSKENYTGVYKEPFCQIPELLHVDPSCYLQTSAGFIHRLAVNAGFPTHALIGEAELFELQRMVENVQFNWL